MRRWPGLVVVVGLLGLVACSDDGASAPTTSMDVDRATKLALVRSEIESAMAGGAGEYRSLGLGDDVVEVGLRADQSALAANLVARYGDLVEVMLGLFVYPGLSAGTASDRSSCGPSPTGPSEVSGLTAALHLSSGSVASGADFAGIVTVTNTSSAEVTFDTGIALDTAVVTPGTTTVVNGSSEIAGVGLSPSLAPGASVDIPVVGGTASCDPALGYALPPGTYDALVAVPVALAGGETVWLVSAPATLTVTGTGTGAG